MTTVNVQHTKQSSLWLVIHFLEMLAALQIGIAEVPVHTLRHRLEADEFPMFSGGY